MNGTSPILIAAIIIAIAIDFGLMYLLRGTLNDDRNAPRATFLGAYSPFLAWLRYHRLPRIRVKSPSFFRHIPWAVVGLALALLLVVISQWQLLDRPSKPGWPLFGLALSSLTFLVTNRRILPPDPAAHFTPILPQLKIKRTTMAVVLLSLSLAASVSTIQMVDLWYTAPMDYLPVLSWWISILLFIAAILIQVEWHWPGKKKLSVWWHGNWQEGLLILGLFILALIVRIVDLPWFPYAMMNDEGQVGKAALAILNGLTTNMFRTGWSSQPIWSFVPNALMIALIGNSLTAVRLVSAIEGALAVVFLYLLAREAIVREVALLASVGLVGLAWHIHFSRLGVHNIIDSLSVTVVLWLTYRAMQRGHLADYLFAGLVTGLTFYTYVGSRLVLVLALGLLIFGLLRRTIRLREHAIHMFVYLGAAAIIAGPMSAHFRLFGNLREKAIYGGQAKSL